MYATRILCLHYQSVSSVSRWDELVQSARHLVLTTSSQNTRKEGGSKYGDLGGSHIIMDLIKTKCFLGSILVIAEQLHQRIAITKQE